MFSLIESLLNNLNSQQIKELKLYLENFINVFNTAHFTEDSVFSKLISEYKLIIIRFDQNDLNIAKRDLYYLRGSLDILPSLITTNINLMPHKKVKRTKEGESSNPPEDSEPKVIMQTSFFSIFAYFLYVLI